MEPTTTTQSVLMYSNRYPMDTITLVTSNVTIADMTTTKQSILNDDRIVGGFPIPITRAPYQVSLMRRKFHICGGKPYTEICFNCLNYFLAEGSIISLFFVMTAAHCEFYQHLPLKNVERFNFS